MKVFLATMSGGYYEEHWQCEYGIYSTMEQVMEEFEKAKKMYAIGKEQLDKHGYYNSDIRTEEMEFAFFYEDWDWFTVMEWEVDKGICESCHWEYNNGEWIFYE